MNNKALELQNISYAYRTNWLMQRLSCLRDVTLSVNAGESFGFLGHNGAGKTTTIKCILNLVQPQQGRIKIFGKDTQQTNSRISVGYLPEQPYFYDYLTVFEIMEMYATLAGVPAKDRRSSVEETLDQVGLGSRLKSKTRSLSKGLIQRLAMAQAVIAKPKLLVLDEPFSGLDPVGRKEFADLIQNLKENGTTIFMSSHILSDVEHLCERVSIMINGQIKGVYSLGQIGEIMHGHYELLLRTSDRTMLECLPSPSEQKSTNAHTRLSYEKIDLAHQALEAAINKKLQVESFQFVHGGLESLFVKLLKQSNKDLGQK